MIPALWLGALLSFQAVGADAGAAGRGGRPSSARPPGSADAGAAPDGGRGRAAARRWRRSRPAKVTVRGRVLARGGRDPVAAASLLLDAAAGG